MGNPVILSLQGVMKQQAINVCNAEGKMDINNHYVPELLRGTKRFCGKDIFLYLLGFILTGGFFLGLAGAAGPFRYLYLQVCVLQLLLPAGFRSAAWSLVFS